MKALISIIAAMLALVTLSCRQKEVKMLLVSGNTAENKSDVGLYMLGADGTAAIVNELTVGNNPSFFEFGDNGLVYFINETDSFNLAAGGGITTLRIDSEKRKLEVVSSINQGGGGPCHIALADDKKHLITANYGSGSISVVRIDKDGIPAQVTDVIFLGEESHPHMTLYNPAERLYYVTDLGLDKIHIYRLDSDSGRLISADKPFIGLPEGAGPRHMALDQDFRNLYVINELNSTMSVFTARSENPVHKQTLSTLPEGCTDKNYCADVHLSANGKYLYGSNRGHNSIVIFRVSINGRLSLGGHVPCGGEWPRNFATDLRMKYLVVGNQRSDEVTIFALSKAGGVMKNTGHTISFTTPACIRFLK